MANKIKVDVSLVDNLDLVLEATDEQIEMALIAIGAKWKAMLRLIMSRLTPGG